MKVIYIISLLGLTTLTSCLETITLELAHPPGLSFPYIEVIHYSKHGWEILITPTKRADNGQSISFDIEYITLYEGEQAVYTNSQSQTDKTDILYQPIEGKIYSLGVKIKGSDEFRSKPQLYEGSIRIDSILVNRDIVAFNWTNRDVKGEYLITEVNKDGDYNNKISFSDIISNTDTKIPSTLTHVLDLHRDTTYFILNKPSSDVITFLESVSEFHSTFDDGVADPHQVYSNFESGFGIFGFIGQSQRVIAIRE
ncbi:hypothetical protein [Membranihabitans marinus]|uniref:hypothetical protein n=1 Tax=Membranihabitans marinus TaxID=1227546 RepID=UPI001F38B921|nr:hypothetical protein [Membranihabitans marinus]